MPVVKQVWLLGISNMSDGHVKVKTKRNEKQNETGFSENRLIASLFASVMTNFYGNINNLFKFTTNFDSQLRLSRCIIKIECLISPKFIKYVYKNTN